MANVDNTVLWSNNPKKFDEVTKNIEFERQHEFDREPGQIFVRTAWGVPVKQIKQLSAQNPDMIFYAIHSFEHDLYSKSYTLEYRNGEYRAIEDELRLREKQFTFNNQDIIEYGYMVKDVLDMTEGHKLFFEQANCYTACFYKVRELLKYVDDNYLAVHPVVRDYFLNDYEINNNWDRIRFEIPEQAKQGYLTEADGSVTFSPRAKREFDNSPF